MADLATRLGIDPHVSTPDAMPPGPELTRAEFCRRRTLRPETLTRFQVSEVRFEGRPALRFPTSVQIDRIKFLDGGEPKAKWADKGGRAHWYGLGQAKRTGGGPLYFVNGEPSVWACAQSGVAAVCTCTGEGSDISDEMLTELKQSGFSAFRIVYDLDNTGRSGGLKLIRRLREAGLDATALELPAHLGDGSDVDDLHRRVGNEQLAERLTALSELSEPDHIDLEPRETTQEPGRSWPQLAPEARYGLVGEIVAAIEPHTEADPVAVLVQFLLAFGSAVGRGPYFMVEADRHGCNEFVVLVGDTSRSRKGTSLGHVIRLFSEADERWATNCRVSGLSSGEGLIWSVRDPITRVNSPQEENGRSPVQVCEHVVDAGVSDKRLFVIESEYASVLKVLDRKGNNLSPVIRDSWDGHSLRVLTKNSPAKATNPHISILGHITETELQKLLGETEAANGYANRVMWMCVRRSKQLPEGGSLTQEGLSSFVRRIREALEHGRRVGLVRFDDAARELWHEAYGPLSADRPGLLGAMIARAEPHVIRLAMLYALLDRSQMITLKHLVAALALWKYAEDSASYLFGDAMGDPVADRILRIIRSSPEGITLSELHEAFGRHLSAHRLQMALSTLESKGLIRIQELQSGGRPAVFCLPVNG